MNSKSNQIKIMHLNSRSLKKKVPEIQDYIATNNIDICSINETWLRSGDKIKIPGFQILRRDRPCEPGQKVNGGGVAIIIRDSIAIQEIQHTGPEEALTIRILKAASNNEDIDVTSYYNPPDKSANAEFIKDRLAANHPAIVIGDLNGHHPIWDSMQSNSSGRNIAEAIVDSDLLLLNNLEPTYHSAANLDYSAVLDLAIANQRTSDEFLESSVGEEMDSDHLPLLITSRHLSRTDPAKTRSPKRLPTWTKSTQKPPKQASPT